MANNLYVMEAANLFCGDVDPTMSQFLALSEVKLPNLEESYVDHMAGGAPVTIEINTIFQKLESTFTLAGWSPEVVELLASWEKAQNTFTIYGVIRDRRNGTSFEAKAIIEGRLGRANPQSWTRGGLQHWEYAIKGIVSYQLWFAGGCQVEWDFFKNTMIINGDDRNADVNSILRIPVSV